MGRPSVEVRPSWENNDNEKMGFVQKKAGISSVRYNLAILPRVVGAVLGVNVEFFTL